MQDTAVTCLQILERYTKPNQATTAEFFHLATGFMILYDIAMGILQRPRTEPTTWFVNQLVEGHIWHLRNMQKELAEVSQGSRDLSGHPTLVEHLKAFFEQATYRFGSYEGLMAE